MEKPVSVSYTHLDVYKRQDYYLTKPFDMQELTDVVTTLVRRRGEMIPENPSYGNVTLNQADYTLRGPEKQISLGKKEYDIMRILMVNREQVVSKETLLLKVWGNDADAVSYTHLDVYKRQAKRYTMQDLEWMEGK